MGKLIWKHPETTNQRISQSQHSKDLGEALGSRTLQESQQHPARPRTGEPLLLEKSGVAQDSWLVFWPTCNRYIRYSQVQVHTSTRSIHLKVLLENPHVIPSTRHLAKRNTWIYSPKFDHKSTHYITIYIYHVIIYIYRYNRNYIVQILDQTLIPSCLMLFISGVLASGLGDFRHCHLRHLMVSVGGRGGCSRSSCLCPANGAAAADSSIIYIWISRSWQDPKIPWLINSYHSFI